MAPNKKYLSLEEAAAQLGLKTDELIRLREKGEVRGFADRGTWKFKAEEVAEFRRRRQPDSDPDLPIMDDVDDDEDLGRQATVIRQGKDAKSDSDVRVAKPGAGASKMTDSDSDVRLISPAKSIKQDSDSDVKLVEPRMGSKSDSDSDVKMFDSLPAETDSDSDVKLLATSGLLFDSDSDVRLAPELGSDSDVKLIETKPSKGLSDSDSDVALLPRGSTPLPRSSPPKSGGSGLLSPQKGDIDFDLGGSGDDESVLDGDDSSISFTGDSGIRLTGDSGIRLSGDSGIRMAGDSGIRLAGLSGVRLGGDSGIRLSDDSGVQLKQPADSGISLEGMDSAVRLGDSGISLGEDSGLNLLGASSSHLLKGGKKSKGSSSNLLKGGGSKPIKGGSSKKIKGSAADDLDVTSPMLLSGLDDDLDSTSPLLGASDIDDASAGDLDLFDASDTSEMQSLGDSGQNVVMFEDDEEAEPAPKKRKQKTVEESIFETDEAGEEPLDELEVSDDDLSGESEIDEMAFDDDDEELDESFTAGASRVGFGGAQKVAVAHEVEWSAGFCSLLMASVCVLICGSVVAIDLLRTTWAQGSNGAVFDGFAGLLAGLWK